jgi:hypothetical protein
MRTRELDIVDGTNVEAGYVFVDWSPSGDAAYIAGGQANRQLIRYDLAEDEAKAIRVDVGPFYGMAAV